MPRASQRGLDRHRCRSTYPEHPSRRKRLHDRGSHMNARSCRAVRDGQPGWPPRTSPLRNRLTDRLREGFSGAARHWGGRRPAMSGQP